MQKRLFVVGALVVYSALVATVMVFRYVPVIHIGHLMFNFGGADANGQANFIPLTTILPYLLGRGGIIGLFEIFGNIIPLVPIGFLVAFLYRTMSWKKAVVLSAAVGVAIEGAQVLFHTGIFDIDDVLLNGLGVLIGYAAFIVFIKNEPHAQLPH